MCNGTKEKKMNAATNANIKLPIYLDYQATTPVDPRVMEAMLPWFTEKFGNPHSRSHAFGWEAEEATEIARRQIAELIGAASKEIIFTSGATESNNLALKGVMDIYGKEKNHIITAETEHKCVLDTCRALERNGVAVTCLPVDRHGLIDLKMLDKVITDKTCLVSVMAVNNEIGLIQPFAEIGALCRERGVFFHTDAAQAFGKIPLDVQAMHIDLMSISGHKIYGPKGIGALYVRRRPKVRVLAQMSGGGQERGMRSGTLPTPLVVGLGKAAEIARAEMAAENTRLWALRNHFLDTVMGKLPEVTLNGHPEKTIPGNINLSFSGIEGDALVLALKDLAVSSGSACTSATLEPSHVLSALGVPEAQAQPSVRFGFGRFTTPEEVDYAAGHVVESVTRLRGQRARQAHA